MFSAHKRRKNRLRTRTTEHMLVTGFQGPPSMNDTCAMPLPDGLLFKPEPEPHPEPDRRPLAIDLFSGCGGLTLGLKQADFRVIGAIEMDSLACETYLMNHLGVAVWPNDIRCVCAETMMRAMGIREGELDLIAGCPPCQGFSTLTTLNNSKKQDDERNDLVFEYMRFVRVFLPKAVMLENVPGLRHNWRMSLILEQLAILGYSARTEVLDAADYGVPQRRKRLILVAGRRGRIDLGHKVDKAVTVATAIRALPKHGESGDPLHDFPEHRSKEVMARIASTPKDGGSRADAGTQHALACHERCDGFKDVYGRMRWADVSPTITSGCFNPSKGRFLHPEEDRAITLREAALLQSFPPNYKFSLRRGKTNAATMIGNALPPEFIRRHAVKIAEYVLSKSTPIVYKGITRC